MNEVHHGDCVPWLAGLPDNSVDVVFTDPPYGHTENGSLAQRCEAVLGWSDGQGQYRDGAYAPIVANDGREANDLFRGILPELRRVLKPGCCCCCCCAGGGGPDPQFARWSLWLDEVFEFKQMVVWDKGPMGMGWHYRRSYETVLVAMKPGAKCAWYDTTKRVENVIRPGQYGIRKIIPASDQHPTEKPPHLAAHFIQLHSKPGNVVLDPFCGSGSTLEAAQALGRNYLGCELDAHWHSVASQRLGLESAPMDAEDMPLFAGAMT